MIGLFALAAASAANCPVENAHYRLRHAPEVEAYFRKVDSGSDWPSGVALAIHFRGSGHTYWWLPGIPGSDRHQALFSTTEVTAPGWRPPSPDGGPRPYGSTEYLGLDASYDILGDMPHRGSTAPAHMLLAYAGNPEFSHGAGNSIPNFKQFFDLVSCSAKGG